MPTCSQRIRTALLGAATAPAVFLSAGCQGPRNDGLTIGRSVEISTLAPTERVSLPRTDYDEHPTPSLRGVSRANWEPTAFTVPVDGVEHYAAFGVHPDFTDRTARQGGGHPTEQSALELSDEAGAGQQALEALAAPFYSGLDILMAVPRWVFHPPWTVMRSPRDAYERAPHGPAGGAPADAPPPPRPALPGGSGAAPPIPTIPPAPPAKP